MLFKQIMRYVPDVRLIVHRRVVRPAEGAVRLGRRVPAHRTDVVVVRDGRAGRVSCPGCVADAVAGCKIALCDLLGIVFHLDLGAVVLRDKPDADQPDAHIPRVEILVGGVLDLVSFDRALPRGVAALADDAGMENVKQQKEPRQDVNDDPLPQEAARVRDHAQGDQHRAQQNDLDDLGDLVDPDAFFKRFIYDHGGPHF